MKHVVTRSCPGSVAPLYFLAPAPNGMITMSRARYFLAVAAAICLHNDYSATRCEAAGIWNMPSNLRQTMGLGFGPGYHAPIVKTYWFTSKVAAQPVKRVLRAPQSSACANGFCGGMTMLDSSYSPRVEPTYHAPPQSQAPVYQQPKWQGSLSPGVVNPPEGISRPATQPTNEMKTLTPRGQQGREPASPSDGPKPIALPLPPG